MTGKIKKIEEEKESTQDNSPEFFFEDPYEEALGIQTAIYPNGKPIKRVELSDGRIAVVHELNGQEMQKVEVMANYKQEKQVPAIIALSTKINGEAIVMEDLDFMRGKDYNKLKIATGTINF